MARSSWNPWKITAVGMALVIVTALVTGLVIANWSGKEEAPPVAAMKPALQAAASREPARQTVTPSAPVRQAAATPTASDIEACNQYAKSQTGSATTEVLKDAVIGGVIGAGVGAAGGAIAGKGGKDAGKGAAVGGVVGATAGTLYGLNEVKKNDARYAEAYSACMRGRGYSS